MLYSWAPVTDALIDAGLVEQVDGTYYVTDFPRLIEMIDAETPWNEIGLPQLPGPISITTSDPTTSNSGNSFAGLLASTYNGGRLIDDETIDGVVEQVEAFYDRLGPLEQSSGFLFDQYVNQGMNAYPIIAGYESSMIEFKVAQDASPSSRSRSEVRLLYPQPTVWSSHPLIPLTANGEKLHRRAARRRHPAHRLGAARVPDRDLQRPERSRRAGHRRHPGGRRLGHALAPRRRHGPHHRGDPARDAGRGKRRTRRHAPAAPSVSPTARGCPDTRPRVK